MISIFSLLVIVFNMAFADEFKSEKENYVYVFQKSINHPTTKSSESDFSYNCVKQNTKSNDIYNQEAFEKHKKEVVDKVIYVPISKDTKNYFYIIRDVSRMYGDNFINVEGVLYANSKKQCEETRNEVKNATRNYAVKRNDEKVK